jgi:hypothetical protein
VRTRAALLALVAIASLELPAAPASAQRRAPRQATPDGPVHEEGRTPWGHPDLQGRWSNATLTPLERPADLGAKEFFTPEEAAAYGKNAFTRYLAATNLSAETELAGETTPELWGEARSIVPTRRTSLIVGTTGRLPAITPQARERLAARAALGPFGGTDSHEQRQLNERCLWFSSEGPPMLPSITYNSHYQIVQTPTHVVINAEMGGGTRIIPIDGRPHLPSAITRWLGDSRGRWEHDTLVVETTNIYPAREWRGSSSGMRVVERFRRSGSLLIYEVTVRDDSVWAEPWTAEIPMTRMDGLIYEYACHEGNRTIEHVLAAARKAEGR